MDFVCNILIETDLSFEIFKRSSVDFLKSDFSRFHFCIRGTNASKAYDFIERQNLNDKIHIYKQYDLNNWLFVMNEILKNISSNKFYLYFEDHFLQLNHEDFALVLQESDVANFDVMNTSFYQAIKFNQTELALFKSNEFKTFETFEIGENEINLLLTDGGERFIIGINSIFSKEYFEKNVLCYNDYKSLYSRVLPKFIWRLFPKGYRMIYRFINQSVMNKLGFHLYWYDPASPFNFEFSLKDLVEKNFIYALPNKEVCANLDDDNGALNSCLWKRGDYLELMPVASTKTIKYERNRPLEVDGTFNIRYIPRLSRVTKTAYVSIILLYGEIRVDDQKLNFSEPKNVCIFRRDGIKISGQGKVKIRLIE